MFFFRVDEWREDPIPLDEGHHRHSSEKPFKWPFAGEPMVVLTLDVGLAIFHGIRTNIAKEPYSFVIFQRTGGVQTLDPHMIAPISTCWVLQIFTFDFLSQSGGAVALLIYKYIHCVDEKQCRLHQKPADLDLHCFQKR